MHRKIHRKMDNNTTITILIIIIIMAIPPIIRNNIFYGIQKMSVKGKYYI